MAKTVEEIAEELRKYAGIKTKEEIEYSICASAVQIISDMCCVKPQKIIELLTDWAWDEEEAGKILRLTTGGSANENLHD